MSIRKISFSEGEYYHVFNRGNGKQIIFHDAEDYNRFIGLLYVCNQRGSFKADNLQKNQGLLSVIVQDPLVAIGAYCLMSNHFHMLLKEVSESSISIFMQKLSTAYVMYYNKKYKRSGSLFEGKFKAEHIDTDRYLKYIYSYIHLNPLKIIDKNWKTSGLISKKTSWNFLKEYDYSSFADYCRPKNRKQYKILNTKVFPQYFPSATEFISDIKEWFHYGELR